MRRFNHLYGKGQEILVEPKPTFAEVPEVPGTDGRKMSKSYNNAIYLADDEATTAAKIKKMVTDPAKVRRNDPGHPEICPVFTLWGLIAATGLTDVIASGCRSGVLGCAADKADFTEALNTVLRPIRERRALYAADPGAVDAILAEGTARAREVAAQTIHDVKVAMQIL